MRCDTQRIISKGDSIELHVVEFNGKPVLETEFVEYDSELRAHELKTRGIRETDFEKCHEFEEGYIDGHINFRSVRIFHIASNEQIKLTYGDKVGADIVSAYIAKEPARDGRRKLHVTICDVRHVYHWTRHRDVDPDMLVITLSCGTREIKKKQFPITRKQKMRVENGRAYPIIAEMLPKEKILSAVSDAARRPVMTTGDYYLAQRQKGRTAQDIDKDLIRVPIFDRTLPMRDRRHLSYTTISL